ncbi:TetR/AcrR family transcriptional regulator [Kineosporia rhizophila]|uniref:TetR/AcrR family transcriptional regulator n=1 Tax=Kineosporia TaxID=49184 RepID=UPI001E416D13|nr:MULTISPECIES: TetR/AcrR family transcriptional regulator [Kineosporia]MCE0534674.1 TetR/AcrR family transcriptional regulator [Kineosporia rhizophila]GLY19402.1 TetR family transcriptional regulator [Kineosporia sp. NBRC 101677]
MDEKRSRSTAEVRRATVVAKAIPVFAATGYHATPVTAVADAAGISQAYVFRLFRDKLGLFLAALEHTFDEIERALEAGAVAAPGASPDELLTAMGDAYAGLIADRSLLMMQVHAQSASDVPEIRAALADGNRRIWQYARSRSGAGVAAVQAFLAYGQLCHLIVTAGLDEVDEPWAGEIVQNMTHFPARRAGSA